MTNKVVYNACYGGFSLSAEAVRLGKSLSVDEHWTSVDPKYGFFDGPRHDAALVAVVENLGAAASGDCAKLAIAELDGNQYFIDEYDGFESVVCPGDEKPWVVIP